MSKKPINLSNQRINRVVNKIISIYEVYQYSDAKSLIKKELLDLLRHQRKMKLIPLAQHTEEIKAILSKHLYYEEYNKNGIIRREHSINCWCVIQAHDDAIIEMRSEFKAKLQSLKDKYEKGCGNLIDKRSNAYCGEKVGLNRFYCKGHKDYEAKLSVLHEVEK